MSRVFLRLVLVLGLALCLPARAADLTGTALAREVAVELFLLRMETSMIVYDDTTDAHVKKAKVLLDAVTPQVDACVRELAGRDATASAAVKENWRIVRLSLLGGGNFGQGIFRIGYDAATHGYFDDNAQQMHAALDKAWSLTGGEATLESRALFMAANTVSSYIQDSANPFGSYTNSFNTEESDLNALVGKLDGLLGDMTKKYRANREQADRLRRVVAKWQFIRTTILKAGQQSTPTIVYKHGGDIVRELKAFSD